MICWNLGPTPDLFLFLFLKEDPILACEWASIWYMYIKTILIIGPYFLCLLESASVGVWIIEESDFFVFEVLALMVCIYIKAKFCYCYYYFVVALRTVPSNNWTKFTPSRWGVISAPNINFFVSCYVSSPWAYGWKKPTSISRTLDWKLES